MVKNAVIKRDDVIDVEEYIDDQIAERVDVVRGIQERIGALSEKVESLKAELRELLEQKGSNWSDSEGYAQIVSDGMRKSYDAKTLDELIIKDPLRYGWLKDYRKESPVRGGVKVK
jgi:uncharacterized small protein (DUF1192 family)